MSFPKPLLTSLVALSLGVGCIKLPEVDSAQGDAGVPSANLTVSLSAPSEKTFTNDFVDVQVQVTGGTPDKVELRVDGELMTTLWPPYTYQWGTKATSEGVHRLTAHAFVGDKSFTSELREVVVDRTPPQVVSRIPAPGSQNVLAQQSLQVTFSERIKAASLTDSSARLTTPSAELSRALTLSEDGLTLKVNPSAPIDAPNTLTLTLTTGITDLAGNGLTVPLEPWTWDVPAWLFMGISSQDPGTHVASVSVHVDSRGNHFVSAQPSDGPARIRRWSGGSTWETLESAEGSPFTGRLLNLSMVIDTSDGLLVAWRDPTPDEVIHLGYWNESDGWQAPPLGGDIIFPEYNNTKITDLRLTSKGVPLVLWTSESPASSNPTAAYELSLAQATIPDKWVMVGNPIEFYETTSESTLESASLQVSSSDEPLVAWHGFDDKIHVSHWDALTSEWHELGQGIRANPTNSYLSDPIVRMDRADNIYLAWREAVGGIYSIHVRKWDGGTWQPLGAELSAYTGNTSTSAPRMEIDALGRPIVAWTEFPGDPQYIHIRVWADSAWKAFGPSLSGNQGFAPANAPPAITLDAQGSLVIAWAEDISGKVFVYRQNK